MTGSSGLSVWPSLLAFAVVVALIPIALALVKRAQQLRPNRQGMLSLVGGLNVGAHERIAIVETSGKWLIVGVTAQSITLLATLDEPPKSGDSPADSPPHAPAAFSRLLAGFKHDAHKNA